jgi:hypothetical protein
MLERKGRGERLVGPTRRGGQGLSYVCLTGRLSARRQEGSKLVVRNTKKRDGLPRRPKTTTIPSASLASGKLIQTTIMRVNILHRPLFDSFVGIMDIKQGKMRASVPLPLTLSSLLTLCPPLPLSRCHARHPFRRMQTLNLLNCVFSNLTSLSSLQLLNKVAGVYGLLGFLTAGGSLSQLSYYLYSTLSLAAFIFGLRAISDEQTVKVQQFAHFFVADHLLGTLYTLLFAVNWWVYVKHDGERLVNGEAQKAMIELAISRGEVGGQELSVEERAKIALVLWGKEKAFAVVVLVACWVLKVCPFPSTFGCEPAR